MNKTFATFAHLVLFAISLFALQAQAVIEVGDGVPDQCWKTSETTDYCLNQTQTIRVLLFNSGWCGSCNEEFQALIPAITEFDGKPITFISLSAAGWSRPAPPNSKFLQQWKEKHNIPFTVAASPKDLGASFFEPPHYIPNVAVIDQTGKLRYKAIEPGVEGLLKEIRKLLP